MGRSLSGLLAALVAALLAAAAQACARRPPAGEDRLVVGAYTAPREAFEQAVIPAFRRAWKARTGRGLQVRSSYLGSGAQAAAVLGGFPADVVVLALEGDVDRLASAGLVAADWRERTGNAGTVARSLVVIAVRPGDPLGLRDLEDLARPGLHVVAPNPRTSGAARWAVLALYAAGGAPLVRQVFANVQVMDKGARESLVTFERGIGDAALTYEEEVHVARLAGRRMDYAIPKLTLRVDVPAAVVDRNVTAHGTREVASAFVEFLLSPEGQALLADYGYRPARGRLTGADPRFPEPPGQVLGIEAFGGWTRANRLFAEDGPLTLAVEQAGTGGR